LLQSAAAFAGVADNNCAPCCCLAANRTRLNECLPSWSACGAEAKCSCAGNVAGVRRSCGGDGRVPCIYGTSDEIGGSASVRLCKIQEAGIADSEFNCARVPAQRRTARMNEREEKNLESLFSRTGKRRWQDAAGSAVPFERQRQGNCAKDSSDKSARCLR